MNRELDSIIDDARGQWGWHVKQVKSNVEWQQLTHHDVPAVRVDVLTFTQYPHFRGRVLVYGREQAELARLGDLRALLVDTSPAVAFAAYIEKNERDEIALDARIEAENDRRDNRED